MCIHTGACSWHSRVTVALPTMEEAGGSSPPEQKATEAEIFLSKGFNFPDDLTPKICRIQISIPELWQRACQGEERVRKLPFRKYASSSGGGTGHLQAAEVMMSQAGSCQCHAKVKGRPHHLQTTYPTWAPCGACPSASPPQPSIFQFR